MDIVELSGFSVAGIATRTTNTNETDPATAKIGSLWGEFYQSVASHLTENSRVYGLYTGYESDASGAFDVLAGASHISQDVAGLTVIDVAPGRYLKFAAQGDMPDVVIALWGEVWRYFADASCPHVRLYTTDFECYVGPNDIEIFIAIA